MVPPAVHAVLALHTDQHAGADEQAGWAGQEGVVAATQCSITWLLRQKTNVMTRPGCVEG